MVNCVLEPKDFHTMVKSGLMSPMGHKIDHLLVESDIVYYYSYFLPST